MYTQHMLCGFSTPIHVEEKVIKYKNNFCWTAHGRILPVGRQPDQSF